MRMTTGPANDTLNATTLLRSWQGPHSLHLSKETSPFFIHFLPDVTEMTLAFHVMSISMQGWRFSVTMQSPTKRHIDQVM